MKKKPKDPLQINSKIEMMKEEDNRIYTGTIWEVMKDGFTILDPTYKRSKMSLRKGDRVQLKTFSGSLYYAFEAYFIGIIKEKGHRTVHFFSYPEDIKKVQRRNFVRAETIFDVSYKMLEKKDLSSLLKILKNEPDFPYKAFGINLSGGGMISCAKESELDFPYKAFGIDLSGGGMMLRVKESIPEKSFVLVKFELTIRGVVEEMVLLGQVMRNIIGNTKDGITISVGLSFHNIKEKTREKIITYIFDKMIEDTKKGF